MYYRDCKKALSEIMNNMENVEIMQIYGQTGNGKSTLLKDLSDDKGFAFV